MPPATASQTSSLQQEYANPPEGNGLHASFGYGLRNGLGSRGKRPIPALKEAQSMFSTLLGHTPFAPRFLLILLLLLLTTILLFTSIGCKAAGRAAVRTLADDNVNCGKLSWAAGWENQIDWQKSPTITDGYLSMAGINKGDVSLNGVNDNFAKISPGLNLPAFTLLSVDDDPDTEHKLVASIWSPTIELEVADSTILHAEVGRFKLTRGDFDVRVKLTDSIIANPDELIILVWPHIADPEVIPIGLSCIDRN